MKELTRLRLIKSVHKNKILKTSIIGTFFTLFLIPFIPNLTYSMDLITTETHSEEEKNNIKTEEQLPINSQKRQTYLSPQPPTAPQTPPAPQALNFTISKGIKKINLNEDVPGCTDNYFRCAISCWRISSGWFDLTTVLATCSVTFLGSLNTWSSLSEGTKNTLGIAGLVCGGTAVFCQTLKVYSTKAIQDYKSELEEIIIESHPIPTPTLPNNSTGEL